MRRRLAACFLGSIAALPAGAAEGRNLWEWMNVAPIVALLEVGEQDGGETLAEVERVFHGTIGARSTIALDVRRANRERPGGARALSLRKGGVYLALLEPSGKRRDPEKRPLYRLVRGVEGVREIPAEGAPAWIEAADRIAAIRALENDPLVWEALGALLAHPNPILMRTGLDAHETFGRGDSALFPSLLPLLSHPAPDVRAEASAVSGICLRRDPDSAGGDAGREIVLRLIALARRDPDSAVRIAATRSLAEVRDAAVGKVLEEVAADDPEQNVRFEAERLLVGRASGRSRGPD
jgi:hypothetical protein